MAVHAEMQRFESLQELPSVERTHARTEVAHPLHASLQNVGEFQATECLEELEAVVAGVWLGHLREATVVPRGITFLDDDATDRRAVAADTRSRESSASVDIPCTASDETFDRLTATPSACAHADGVAVKHLTHGRARYSARWRTVRLDPSARSSWH